jgi:hypothetical protein
MNPSTEVGCPPVGRDTLRILTAFECLAEASHRRPYFLVFTAFPVFFQMLYDGCPRITRWCGGFRRSSPSGRPILTLDFCDRRIDFRTGFWTTDWELEESQ